MATSTEADVNRSVVFATSVLRALPELARQAEGEGFHRAWTTEYTDRDALIRAALVGAATTTLRVGTGITYSFNRHPVTLAAAAADLHEATEGRFSLGLGAGTRGMRRGWFGLDIGRPVAMMREAVSVVRHLWASDGAVTFHGEFFDVQIPALHTAARLSGLAPLTVHGSGLNASMVREAGTWCDGLLLHPLSVSVHGQRLLREAGLPSRSPGQPDPELSQWVITSVAADREVARRRARQSLAFYLSTPSYASQFAGTQWAAVPAAVSEGFRRSGPQWDQLGELVPEEMLDDYCLSGAPAEVADRFLALQERLQPSGVSEMVLQVAVTSLDEEQTAEAVTEALRALGPPR